MLAPKKIKLKDEKNLMIIWNDGSENIFPLKVLRDESPDAGNKGETVLWRHYPGNEDKTELPGKYEIKAINTVGNYAINIEWKDGNSDGIYSWDYLKKLSDDIEIKKILPDLKNHKH